MLAPLDLIRLTTLLKGVGTVLARLLSNRSGPPGLVTVFGPMALLALAAG